MDHQRNLRRKRLEKIESTYRHNHNHDSFRVRHPTHIQVGSRRTIPIVTVVIGKILKVKLLGVIIIILHITTIIKSVQCQQQDPMSLNGGSILAMTGKDCIAIAVDKRFGLGNRLINNRIPRSILLLPNPIDISTTETSTETETDTSGDNNDCSSSILSTTTTTTEENDKTNDNDDNTDNNNIFITSPQNVLIGFTGLDGDIQSLMIDIYTQVQNQLSLVTSTTTTGSSSGLLLSNNKNELHIITPKSISSLTSHILYNRKQSPYYVEPIIVGFQQKDSTTSDDTDSDENNSMMDSLHTKSDITSTTTTAFTTRLNQVWGSTTNKKKQQQQQQQQQLQKTKLQYQQYQQEQLLQKQQNNNYFPYLCSMDCIGAVSYSTTFVCIGTASTVLYGIAESLWKPNMIPAELLSTIVQTFQYAIQRNSLSGSGPIIIYIYHMNGTIIEYTINNRYD